MSTALCGRDSPTGSLISVSSSGADGSHTSILVTFLTTETKGYMRARSTPQCWAAMNSQNCNNQQKKAEKQLSGRVILVHNLRVQSIM